MLQLLSPKAISESPYRTRLAEAGIKGGWNYALDHAWLFENIDRYMKDHENETPLVLDVGCGNSMLHTFLEGELRLGIIGIDRIFGKCPYDGRDRRMDLCIDFARDGNTFFNENVDIVYWCSSIEHNTITEQSACVEASMNALKPGGIFLATFGYSASTHYYEQSEQTNLSREDAEKIYNETWVGITDFDAMVTEYRKDHFGIDTRHKKRYGTDEYAFIVGAVKKTK